MMGKRPIIIGIYLIISPSGRKYVGQSVNIYKRWKVYENGPKPLITLSQYEKNIGRYIDVVTIEGKEFSGKLFSANDDGIELETKKRTINFTFNQIKKVVPCIPQPILHRSLKKYGPKNHKFDIICTCEPEELNKLEIYHIAAHNSFNSKEGMNATSGGDSDYKMSDETKSKIRASKIGSKNPMFGKKQSAETLEKRSKSLRALERKLTEDHMEKMKAGRIAAGPFNHTEESKKKIGASITGEKHWNFGGTASEETRLKQSESHKGEKSYMFGKDKSAETKAKMSSYSKNRSPEHLEKIRIALTGKKASPETRKKQSEAKKGEKSVLYKKNGILNPHSIKVVQLDLLGNFIKVWDAMADVGRELGINKTNVCSVCKGKTQTAGGFKWKYYTEETNLILAE